MNQTSMSKKGQIVIPHKIRKALGINPSNRFQVTTQGSKVVMTPIAQIEDVYGMFNPKKEITKEKIKQAKRKEVS